MYSQAEPQALDDKINKRNMLISDMDMHPSPLIANSKYKNSKFIFESSHKTHSLSREDEGQMSLNALKR